MRLLGNGAVAHGSGGEPLDNFAGGFHFFQRNRLVGGLDVEQPAQGAELARLVVDQVGVFLEGGEALVAHGCLQLLYGLRINQVVLAAHAELIVAADRQLGIEIVLRRESVLVLENGLLGQHFEPDAFDPAGGAGEILVDQAFAESDGFEDLSAAIALQRGDAHLAESLEEALVDALDEIRHGLLFGADRFQRQIRIDGARAVTDEEGEVHHLARLAALQDERHLGTRLFAHQVIVDRRHGQQAGDRGIFFIHAAVGENQQSVAGLDGEGSAPAELGECPLQALGALFHGEKHGQRGGQEIALADAAHLFQVAVGENGMRQLHGVAVLRRLVQDVALRADVAGERHHHLFADGVDGRVGDLGE